MDNFFSRFLASVESQPLYREILQSTQNDPAAPQDHCGRRRGFEPAGPLPQKSDAKQKKRTVLKRTKHSILSVDILVSS